MAARAHRKGFSPTLPSDGWQSEDCDGPWEAYKERCVREGARMVDHGYGEYIEWRNDYGQIHREDGPAHEYNDGLKEWYVNGRQHREDGPAVEYADGYKMWWVNDQLHRLDGPACENLDGDKAWWVSGKIHRLDGPAIESANGSVKFYKDGIEYTDITFTQRV